MHDYPALLDLATQAIHPLGVSESFLIGRNETADVCVLDPSCSRHHFRIVRRDDQYQVEPLNARDPTYHQRPRGWRPEALEHGATLRAGQARFRFLLRPPDGAMAADVAAGPMP